jgi:glutamate dehydrogenase (NAD(P)+)
MLTIMPATAPQPGHPAHAVGAASRLIPDVVANSGGVICAAAEYRGAGRVGAFTEITEKIRDTTGELIDRIRHGTLTPRAAAGQMAQERLEKVLSLRREF